ncbi:MAG: 2,3-bisphosphoglycerate-independent phosphoglycerate mutase, partial [Oscillospiraceae bacterium]|nr:2,3-bisphosphoglycerate-independent phosphoglycerate mutase [Oscillospiraceae bacterium]
MDGYALAEASEANAITAAHMPYLASIFKQYPTTELQASGEDVGLPEGQMGNSEVGHVNIGAGRVVYQDLPRITAAIRDGSLFENAALKGAMEAAKAKDGALHFFGLMSDGGVHSHLTHLWGLLEMAKRGGLTKVYLHCFLDGRDVPPKSAAGYIKTVVDKCREIGVGKVATVMGRYWAMDRDKRWERVEAAYKAIAWGEGILETDPVRAIEESYTQDVTDEFVKPVVCDPAGMVKEGDSVIFFNYRPDRAREITRAFVDPDFDGFPRKNGYFPLHYVCMTQYDEAMPNVHVAFPPQSLAGTL